MIAEVKKYTEQFQIEHLLKKNPYELSGGEAESCYMSCVNQ